MQRLETSLQALLFGIGDLRPADQLHGITEPVGIEHSGDPAGRLPNEIVPELEACHPPPDVARSRTERRPHEHERIGNEAHPLAESKDLARACSRLPAGTVPMSSPAKG